METKKENSFQSQIFSDIESIVGFNNKITVPDAFLVFCGDLETAVFLSQLIYWCDKSKSSFGIYKTYEEWKQEIGLSKYHIRKATRKFEGMGFLSAKLKKANGYPTIHYRLNQKAFRDTFVNFLTTESRKLKNRIANFSHSITDTTTDTTTETTKDNKGVNSCEIHSIPFKRYKELASPDQVTCEAIEYFLKAYKRKRGGDHPKLKSEQWQSVENSLLSCNDLERSFDLGLDEIKEMIDKYFDTTFKGRCDYRILHFNNEKVKLHRMYETVY